MSIHKLTAGSGYDYLTRQVAALDATDKGYVGLASYYTEHGETPGVWIGSGMAGIEGLAAGDVVTAEQMQSLFGSGHHPLAAERTAALDRRASAAGLLPHDGGEPAEAPTVREYRDAARLGQPFKIYDHDVSDFRIRVALLMQQHNTDRGLPADWPVPASERARIRTQVAGEFFRAEHGRDPADARETAATIAKHSRPKTTAVAGYDLTFSPVKSVSVLWAVADPQVAAVVEQAHQDAVADALCFLEREALYTRTGTNGVRQVDVTGLVATAFTHRDSRAGDPDLHTHVAVANKVHTHPTQAADGQTRPGRWLSVDGRMLFKATVSASETYNTALERHLVARLGVRFAERPNPDPRKRPVREIVGINPRLNERFSKRRASVEDRRDQLVGQFQATHGRPPTAVETLQLAQQATLETREAKHHPRTLAEQRTAWHTEAEQVLGATGGIQRMVHHALHPQPEPSAQTPDAAWVQTTAEDVADTLASNRSTWQYWHVYAEAQRRVRPLDLSASDTTRMVDSVAEAVLTTQSVALSKPTAMASEAIVDPEPLRRLNGDSMYSVARSLMYTSTAILDAERLLVEVAGRDDGHRADDASVDIALLESTANGVTLNAGQTTLVRAMATSGARLQLAIAPAGSGKTTAMRALASAWTTSGGTVIGLAPSAAAADALREQIHTPTGTTRDEAPTPTSSPTPRSGASSGPCNRTCTDTLAKLVWSLDNDDLPAWADRIGPDSLVIIDEAGMADTLSLATAVEFVTARGGSVRLIGDDQQLAAIGAGGVLRDIAATHGALHLTELVRFTDPAEAAASLALREGRPEALGYYLDHHRIHIGDLATMTEDVFAGWAADRHHDVDAIMLAPTRDLVAALNQQARHHRLAAQIDGREAPRLRLGDGNLASQGDLIITRRNNRNLRTTATDWVKNGDRWSITAVGADGSLTAQHLTHGRLIRLPAEYVAEHVDLGYAVTTHSAQGVTADTMHGLLTGQESRQQLYTLATRGRRANHLYLQIVGDGDRHTVIRPDMIAPPTATDILEQVLGRDTSPVSATTLQATQTDPKTLLAESTSRYLDALYVAAEHLLGADKVAALEVTAEDAVPGVTDQPAWPALGAHLILLSASGVAPTTALAAATQSRELATANDKAAVLDWRLDDTGLRSAESGPLPWIPGIPPQLTHHPLWGDYLTQRHQLVSDLADQVAADTHDRALPADARTPELPDWVNRAHVPSAATIAEVEVWRAAMQVPGEDRRPTGHPQLQKAAHRHQRRLDKRIRGGTTPAITEWHGILNQLAPAIDHDDYTPVLAERLAAISRTGINARSLLDHAAQAGPLPDDHAAAALWWRMSHHLAPAVTQQVTDHNPHHNWLPDLVSHLGEHTVADLQDSPWWPALITNIDHALQRGWTLPTLLPPRSDDTTPHTGNADTGAGIEEDRCLVLVWRTSIALDPIPADEDLPAEPATGAPDDHQEPPDDLTHGYLPPAEDTLDLNHIPPADLPEPPDEERAHPAPSADYQLDLAAAAARHAIPGPLPPTDAELRTAYERDQEAAQSPVTRDQLLHINQLTQDFFAHHYRNSWGRDYLTDRLGIDIEGHEHYQPGHAPAGWTNLVTHLRRHHITDTDMLTAGVARRASTGRLIDQFRDRVTLPIVHHGQILGFVARRHPDLTETNPQRHGAGPKYLNTPQTPLFHKGDQLYGLIPELLDQHATPVLVEGPLDAIAVTLASAGRYLGVAPLGTTLTDQQAAQLGHIGTHPVVATDHDTAGQIAAERDYWLLTLHHLDPTTAWLPEGTDPASIHRHQGPAALTAALDTATPLANTITTERHENLPADQALTATAAILAARPAHTWQTTSTATAAQWGIAPHRVHRALLQAIDQRAHDPHAATRRQLDQTNDIRTRITHATALPPAQRWAPLGRSIHHRLVDQPNWSTTAELIQTGHDRGHNIRAILNDLTHSQPLDEADPNRDLARRLRRQPGLCDTTPPAPNPLLTPQSKTTPKPAPTIDAHRTQHGHDR